MNSSKPFLSRFSPSKGTLTSAVTLITAAALTLTYFKFTGISLNSIIQAAASFGTSCFYKSADNSSLTDIPDEIPKSALPGFSGRMTPNLFFSDAVKAEREINKSNQLFPEPNLPPHYEIPDNYYPVIAADLAYRGMELINDTDFYIDPTKMNDYENPFVFDPNETGPIVLVIHTHATESFYEDSQITSLFPHDKLLVGYYKSGSAAPRSSDTEKNVVAVGKVFTDTLNSLGVDTIQDTYLHDYNNYEGAYTSSQNAIKEYMKKYPSIKYVIDIHRDSLIRTNGEKLNPVTVINGENTAQVMCVVGTNQSGYYHPNWKMNLKLAFHFRNELNSIDESMCRPVYLRTGRFNQHLSPGSMLLEIGSCGSRLSEAKNAAKLAASVLAEIIHE
ncbi:MAG: stage II sporulation protein P [Oscillospiraceae bacterium]|nr:stage II sporulation protein P [Oscillospiraceae bacterium]